ncbi:MAG: hypothetical protein AMJ79_03530 [Phycisphaerae bacterium SM23_30]|nr:MAG: hypothetical protein AMJ79_03530 [Phycisphaerae bacterium SM23_30]
MLQAARRAQNLLSDSRDLVVAFIRRQLREDGGFKGRSDNSDLYYTVFGIESLLALGADLPVENIAEYLKNWGAGESLDLVHLACLIRCWADLSCTILATEVRDSILTRLGSYRSTDGGFASDIKSECGSAYACFMALGAYQDLGLKAPQPAGIIHSLKALRTDDGGYVNQRGKSAGSTPATAAAVIILKQMGEPVDKSMAQWLLRQQHPQGGFLAMAAAPTPDLLSTATALHALAALKTPLDNIRRPCLDFLDSLWSSQGGFCGHAFDDTIDCEYTFYGLLALGHLDSGK